MQNNTVRVRIVKAEKDTYWYAVHIGEEFDVFAKDIVEDIGERWACINDEHFVILKSDCVVIPEPENKLFYCEKGLQQCSTQCFTCFKIEKDKMREMGNIKAGVAPPLPEKVNEGEKAGIMQEEAEKYQPLFDLITDMFEHHCIESEMDDIIGASQQVIKNFGGETWATDEDIMEAMEYAFGYASTSDYKVPLNRINFINNYLLSLKNKKA